MLVFLSCICWLRLLSVLSHWKSFLIEMWHPFCSLIQIFFKNLPHCKMQRLLWNGLDIKKIKWMIKSPIFTQLIKLSLISRVTRYLGPLGLVLVLAWTYERTDSAKPTGLGALSLPQQKERLACHPFLLSSPLSKRSEFVADGTGVPHLSCCDEWSGGGGK